MSVTHLHGLHLKCVSACKLTSLWKKSASKADRNVHAPLTGCFECLYSDLFDVIALKTTESSI